MSVASSGNDTIRWGGSGMPAAEGTTGDSPVGAAPAKPGKPGAALPLVIAAVPGEEFGAGPVGCKFTSLDSLPDLFGESAPGRVELHRGEIRPAATVGPPLQWPATGVEAFDRHGQECKQRSGTDVVGFVAITGHRPGSPAGTALTDHGHHAVRPGEDLAPSIRVGAVDGRLGGHPSPPVQPLQVQSAGMSHTPRPGIC